MPFTPYDTIGSVESELGTITINGEAVPLMLINLGVNRATSLQNIPFANYTWGTVVLDYFSKYVENGGRIDFYGLIKAGTSPGTTTAPDVIAYINSTAGQWVWTTIALAGVSYEQCKCVNASLQTADIGGKRIVYGNLSFLFAFTETA